MLRQRAYSSKKWSRASAPGGSKKWASNAQPTLASSIAAADKALNMSSSSSGDQGTDTWRPGGDADRDREMAARTPLRTASCLHGWRQQRQENWRRQDSKSRHHHVPLLARIGTGCKGLLVTNASTILRRSCDVYVSLTKFYSTSMICISIREVVEYESFLNI